MSDGTDGQDSQELGKVESGAPQVSGDPRAELGPQEYRAVYTREEYEGEFPHPRHIEHYEHVVPGSGQMIFDQFQEQGKHRRAIEKQRVEGSERRSNRGQLLGFVLIFLIIVLGFVAVLNGQAVAGCTMVGLALSTGVLVYVFGAKPPKS